MKKEGPHHLNIKDAREAAKEEADKEETGRKKEERLTNLKGKEVRDAAKEIEAKENLLGEGVKEGAGKELSLRHI